MRDNGIEPLGDQVELGPPRNLPAYALRRAYKLHDVLHVALGCDASVLGEVRIVSYSVGQARAGTVRAAALALVVLLLHLVLRRSGRAPRADPIVAESISIFPERLLTAAVDYLVMLHPANAFAEDVMVRECQEVVAMVAVPAGNHLREIVPIAP